MTITETINDQFKKISPIIDDVKALPDTLKNINVSELNAKAQVLAHTALGQATGVYTDLTKRGEALVAKAKCLKVDDVRTDAQKTAADIKGKAEKLVDDVTEKADDFAGDVKEKAEALVADAKKRSEALVADAKATVAKVTGKAAPATPVAKKAPAKSAAPKKAAAKPAAKKAPVKKTTTPKA